MVKTPRVLTVDDDPSMNKVLGALLSQAGMRPRDVSTGAEALALLESGGFDLVITDLRMPVMDGMELLRRIVARWSELPVLVLTAHGQVALAVEAMKAGATDFLLKPFDRDELLFVAQKALAASEGTAERSPPQQSMTREIVGDSAAMHEVHALVRRAAPGISTVLVLGESGTGKELIARALHESSPRRAKPFVKLNCGALPDPLLESELFGHERGAFTGAVMRKPGRIELAHEGTLFLAEIGDVTPTMQVKLLRVLQEREIERLGGSETIKVDVRFIAATHRDLPSLVASGKFREDLYYRLNVVPIHLPPLRARPGDIEVLAQRFTALHAKANARDVHLSQAAIDRLAADPWPGNVRQLENFIERLVVLVDGRQIDAADVERELARGATITPKSSTETVNLDAAVRDAERDTITTALHRAGGNRTVAARILGVSRRSLYYKLEEHKLG